MKKLLGDGLYTCICEKISFNQVNEIRIRLDKNVTVKCKNLVFPVPYNVDKTLLNQIIDVATGNSRYAYENEISRGFLEYGEGIRIGLCGVGKTNDKGFIVFSTITSLCIRVPKTVIPTDFTKNLGEKFTNTLVIGAPYSGKTTFIRTITDIIANKYDVVVLDERKEIAGGKLSLISAKRCDVLQGIPKSLAFENVIRSMSPDVIVCDELFSSQDIDAITRICSSGIKCLASYHAVDVKNIPVALTKNFSNIIILSSNPTPGSIISIVNKND